MIHIDSGTEKNVNENLEEAQGLEGNNSGTDGPKDGDRGGIAVGFYGDANTVWLALDLARQCEEGRAD